MSSNTQNPEIKTVPEKSLDPIRSGLYIKKLLNNIYYCTSGCWIWIGSSTDFGYGRMMIEGKNFIAHRLSYQIFKGHILHNHVVMHSCDNPRCVNPDHLFTGLQKHNIEDMVAKGRQKKGLNTTSNGGWFNCNRLRKKLSDTDISVIKDAYLANFTQQEIADYFKISKFYAGQIIRGRVRIK